MTAPGTGTFQSTRPVRGGTAVEDRGAGALDISIHPPCAGRDPNRLVPWYSFGISIHPPCAGRDAGPSAPRAPAWNFNPPALCGAGQSRRSSWGPGSNFNPPALCGAGRREGQPVRGREMISIHPPCAGRDGPAPSSRRVPFHFNPPALCGAGLLQESLQT